MGSRIACRKCGTMHDIDALDYKPEITPELAEIERTKGQAAMLEFAADSGHDFTRPECATCYGPCYQEAWK